MECSYGFFPHTFSSSSGLDSGEINKKKETKARKKRESRDSKWACKNVMNKGSKSRYEVVSCLVGSDQGS